MPVQTSTLDELSSEATMKLLKLHHEKMLLHRRIQSGLRVANLTHSMFPNRSLVQTANLIGIKNVIASDRTSLCNPSLLSRRVCGRIRCRLC
ncbi:unnamed protein product [Lathyrus oleraceus]